MGIEYSLFKVCIEASKIEGRIEEIERSDDSARLGELVVLLKQYKVQCESNLKANKGLCDVDRIIHIFDNYIEKYSLFIGISYPMQDTPS